MTRTYASSKTSLTGVLLANGTVPLTANWNMGAFSATINSVIIGSAASTISGGSASGGTLTLQSTTNATKGTIQSGNINIVGTALSGSATTSNFFNVTGTLPSVPSVAVFGTNTQITSAGSAAVAQFGTVTALLAGYTGTSPTTGGNFSNAAAGTDATYFNGSYRVGGNRALSATSTATTAGANTGGFYQATGGNANYGIWATSTIAKNNAKNVGVVGVALNTGTTPTQVGGYFALVETTSAPTLISAALIADNGTTTSPIFLAQDNSGTVFSIIDGGGITVAKTDIAAGTTGAQTINKAMGSVNFAAAATTLVVTNSLAATTSNIFVQVEGTDATATSARVTKAAGSFTITLNAAATAETRISFWVIN